MRKVLLLMFVILFCSCSQISNFVSSVDREANELRERYLYLCDRIYVPAVTAYNEIRPTYDLLIEHFNKPSITDPLKTAFDVLDPKAQVALLALKTAAESLNEKLIKFNDEFIEQDRKIRAGWAKYEEIKNGTIEVENRINDILDFTGKLAGGVIARQVSDL